MYRTLLLAWRYIAFHKIKTAILICCITLMAYLPLALHWFVDYSQAYLMSRADSTPLIIGAKGSRFDLALHALYFQANPPDVISMQQVDNIRNSNFALPIPLYVRFSARGFPIVGTTLDYFQFRGLKIAQGTQLVRLGDCLLGAEVAQKLALKPGDRLITDPENVFDISSTYPLNMRVAGILEKTLSPDDYAVFVDTKSAWIIAGIGHGHQDLTKTTDNQAVLKREPGNVIASAALMQYTEITDENIDSFHFHGNTENFPLTAVIAIPHDQKSQTLLIGRYESKNTDAQILNPVKIVNELMGMIFKVKRFFDANVVLVTISTLLFLVLVVLLSLQLRRREMETMFKLGCSRLTIFWLQATELAIILAAGFALAGGLALVTIQYAPYLIRELLF
ncbi:MAG: ABC transporter permease [Sedimentisphaerales bacterium]|nr:ABC transporter permease [Sedimentisphaerales bacterium]